MLRTTMLVFGIPVCACAPPVPDKAQIVSGSQRATDILATAPVVFAHDHLWSHQHLQNAQDGKLTASTVDLIVDSLTWQSGTHPLVNACCDGIRIDNIFESF